MTERSTPAATDPSPTSRTMFSELLEGAWIPTRPFSAIRAEVPRERFVTVDGQEVYVEQSGRGEPVVLLHGFACSSYSWRRVQPALARRFRVVAIDLNGFGYTQRPREPERYTIEGQERLILGVLDALKIPSAHFVGHSFGGGLALLLAARHPSRVWSLTLVGSVSPNHHRERRQPWARLRFLNYLVLRFFALRPSIVRGALEECYSDPALVTEELVHAYRERLLVEGLEDAYFGLVAPVDRPPPRIRLSGVRQPVLAVWGDQDRVVPLAESEPLLSALPDVELVTFERCGHNPMEEQPERLLGQLLPFLDRHRRSSRIDLWARIRRWWSGGEGRQVRSKTRDLATAKGGTRQPA